MLRIYTFTIFLSAFLLFWIQPLFAKMALPLLGGSPGVWNTAMLFFQLALLAGYCYVHVLCKYIKFPWQPAVHMLVLCLSFFGLPVELNSSPDGDDIPTFWLLGMLASSIGLPFFALSTSAPLLQRWFSLSSHSRSQNPYFLYAASNAGSLLALISYPIIIEPLFQLSKQSGLWSSSYVFLVGFTALCAVFLYITGGTISHPAPASGQSKDTTISWRLRLLWLGMSFVPSSLLLGVTSHITMDIAAVPLLWVIPLALYLLTFIIAFSNQRILKSSLLGNMQLLCLVIAFLTLPVIEDAWISISVHLTLFFVFALGCHCELVKKKPSVENLTEFYFFLALGGALGGFFNTIIAPLLFNGIYEYGIALVLACLLRPTEEARNFRKNVDDALIPLCLAVLLVVANNFFGVDLKNLSAPSYFCVQLVLVAIVFNFRRSPIRFGLSVGAVLITTIPLGNQSSLLYQERSFFGVHRVETALAGDIHLLMHGSTLHGMQKLNAIERKQPQGYYARTGPLGQFFSKLAINLRSPKDVGLVGLGAGATLCYMRSQQNWMVFEIDPTVVKIARNAEFFTYWSDCVNGERTQLVMGDARLSLAKEPNQKFDLLILDAYSSDAIPVHLLTRESLQLYRSKIRVGGFLLFHLSNRHLDLTRVLAALLFDAELKGMIQEDDNATWVVVAGNGADLDLFTDDTRWQPLKPSPGTAIWTDDFSNILGALK